MEYHVLGPLEVVRDGRTLELGAGKQRTLLAVLLSACERGGVDRPPDRRALGRADACDGTEDRPGVCLAASEGPRRRPRAAGADQAAAQRRGVLLTRSPGYVLRVEEGELDSARFATLLAQARATLARGAASEAATAPP